MKKKSSYFWSIILLFMVAPADGNGFDQEAHRALSLRSVNPTVANASQLDSYLRALWFEFDDVCLLCGWNGINQVISGGKTVVDLIADGSVQEDSPVTRVMHHFHDPTRTWDQAGQRFAGIPLGNSSIVWSQRVPQGACCGNFAWKNARDAYFDALTSTTASQRKLKYADTFRTLGHIIHHVQDAAVPSHTRNDNHLQPFRSTLFPDGDPFHHWADGPIGLNRINAITQALRFDPSILNQAAPHPLAPVSISRIIDKTDGDFGVLSPNLNIGLAEYSNANFISKGTARSTTYLYPLYSQLEFSTVETLPNGKRVRYAKFRPGFGEQDYRVGVSSRMVLFANASVPPDSIDFGLDDNVHEDYGRKLFPRAIGYSAGLIDYFFRGRVTVGLPVYVQAFKPPTSVTFTNLTITDVSGSEQSGQGTIQLGFRYLSDDRSLDGLSSEPFPPFVVSQPVPINASSVPQTITFQFNSLPFPTIPDTGTGITSSYYDVYFVYRGRLGQELDAVVAGGNCHNGGAGGDFYFGSSHPNEVITSYITSQFGCPQ